MAHVAQLRGAGRSRWLCACTTAISRQASSTTSRTTRPIRKSDVEEPCRRAARSSTAGRRDDRGDQDQDRRRQQPGQPRLPVVRLPEAGEDEREERRERGSRRFDAGADGIGSIRDSTAPMVPRPSARRPLRSGMHRIRRLGRGPSWPPPRRSLVGGRRGRCVAPPAARPGPDRPLAIAERHRRADPIPVSLPEPFASPTPDRPVACPLSGLPVEDPTLLDQVAIAVQIENHPLARPARNLSNADFVVEVPVEGDTTRFSAVFLCRPTVGLIRPDPQRALLRDRPVAGPPRPPRRLRGQPDLAPAVSPTRGCRTSMASTAGGRGSRAPGPRAPHNLYGDLEALRSALGSGGRDRQPRGQGRATSAAHPVRCHGVVAPGHAVSHVEIQTNSYWHFGWTLGSRLTAGWARQDAGSRSPMR